MRTTVQQTQAVELVAAGSRSTASRPHNARFEQVVLPPDVSDDIDYSLAPGDGLVALDQVALLLPSAHRTAPAASLLRVMNLAPIMTARLKWAGLLLTYIEVDGRFVVIGARPADQSELSRAHCGLDNHAWETHWTPKVQVPHSAEQGRTVQYS